jgi:hypothetical protein
MELKTEFVNCVEKARKECSNSPKIKALLDREKCLNIA